MKKEMKTKENYIKPEIEVIDIVSEGVIAISGEDRIGVSDEDHDGGMARSKKKGFGGE